MAIKGLFTLATGVKPTHSILSLLYIGLCKFQKVYAPSTFHTLRQCMWIYPTLLWWKIMCVGALRFCGCCPWVPDSQPLDLSWMALVHWSVGDWAFAAATFPETLDLRNPLGLKEKKNTHSLMCLICFHLVFWFVCLFLFCLFLFWLCVSVVSSSRVFVKRNGFVFKALCK